MTVERMLFPPLTDVSVHDHWIFPVTQEQDTEFTGTFLGMGSSWRSTHSHSGLWVRPGGNCACCRWTELRLFKADDAKDPYLLCSRGASVVPADAGDLLKYAWLNSAAEVVSNVTGDVVRDVLGGRPTGSGQQQREYLTLPADRLMQQASVHDPDVREAFYAWRTGQNRSAARIAS